jgi:extradiol dioxygenase family protein
MLVKVGILLMVATFFALSARNEDGGLRFANPPYAFASALIDEVFLEDRHLELE